MKRHTAPGQKPQPRFLMCRPQHFAVTYSINPWMDPTAWAATGAALATDAARQWTALQRALRDHGARIELVDPAPGLPDLVFTANAAVVLDRKVLLARFRHPERRGEEPLFAAAFRRLKARGLVDAVIEMPSGVTLEGAGDCIWDPHRGRFWMGHGPRSDPAAGPVVSEVFGADCVPLELADPSFYHLDTALCALPDGTVIYHPGAFTPAALRTIHEHVAPSQRVALDPADAKLFAANAVFFDGVLVLSRVSESLRSKLRARGYTVVATPLDAFLRSGGSACCLTLRLDHRSAAARPLALAAAE
jgi:N-dimethylarginine dimethylaminohydrolase